VDEQLLVVGLPSRAGDAPQDVVDLLEVPGVLQLDGHRLDRRLRRDRADICDDGAQQPLVLALVEQLEAVDAQVLLLADRHGRAPLLPAPGAAAGVEDGPQQAQDYALRGHARELSDGSAAAGPGDLDAKAAKDCFLLAGGHLPAPALRRMALAPCAAVVSCGLTRERGAPAIRESMERAGGLASLAHPIGGS
jgi:hypothetical protein